MTYLQTIFPKSIQHLDEPHIKPHDEDVIIAKISSGPINGYEGHLFFLLHGCP